MMGSRHHQSLKNRVTITAHLDKTQLPVKKLVRSMRVTYRE